MVKGLVSLDSCHSVIHAQKDEGATLNSLTETCFLMAANTIVAMRATGPICELAVPPEASDVSKVQKTSRFWLSSPFRLSISNTASILYVSSLSSYNRSASCSSRTICSGECLVRFIPILTAAFLWDHLCHRRLIYFRGLGQPKGRNKENYRVINQSFNYWHRRNEINSCVGGEE